MAKGMHYIKCLGKNDLYALMDISIEAVRAQNGDQCQKCIEKLNNLIMFDAALSVYTDKEAVDNRRIPGFKHHVLNFSNEFFDQYVKGRYYDESPVFQAVYSTWQPQNWKTAWSMGVFGHGDSSKQLAEAYGYLDGWIIANDHRSSTLSVFAFAGKRVENDKRTRAILRYIAPHLGESLKSVYHSTLIKLKARDQINLSPREEEILKWMRDGKSNWDISRIWHRSERVIKWHINNLMRKLNALNRTHAVAVALRKRLLD